MLSATDFEVGSMCHTPLQAMPSQLVFVCDIILNNPFISDWGSINKCKQLRIDKNNQNEIQITRLITIEYVLAY